MGTRKQATIIFNATTAAAAASSSSSSNHDASNGNSTSTSHSAHSNSVVDDLSDCNAATISGVDELNSSLFGISLAVPEWEALLTVFILTVIIVLTIIGNILVILSVFTYKPLRIVQNFFIVSLAVADLTVALLVLPFNVAYLILGRWEFGITMCKLWLTCDVMCCTSSILNLCVIALDRYWAITDPINYAQKRTLNRVMLLIAGVWVLSFLISSPPLVGWNDWPEEFTSATPCELNSDRGYVIYSSLGSFFIPLVIMTIVYLEIFIATRRRLRERARASRINTMAMSCQSGATNTMRSSIDHAHERPWTQNFLICCTATKATSTMKIKTSSTKPISNKKLANTHKVVMQDVDLESISSGTHANIHNLIDEQPQLHATDTQDVPIKVKEPRENESKEIVGTEVDIQCESSAKSTGDGVVENVDVMVVKKKSRRPKIKDSIRQARRQIPERRANRTGELVSSKKALKSKNGNMPENLLFSKSPQKQKQQEIEQKGDSINRKKNSIEIFVEGDEGTSVYDNDEENESLKTSPPHSSSGGVATSMSVPLQKKSTGGLYQIIEERQKISLSKERRAARTLGIIMGIFVICWLPFSIMYVVLPFCESCCPTNKFKNFITWLGYVNSGLNPVIYTIFNLDYRRAFKRLLNIK